MLNNSFIEEVMEYLGIDNYTLDYDNQIIVLSGEKDLNKMLNYFASGGGLEWINPQQKN